MSLGPRRPWYPRVSNSHSLLTLVIVTVALLAGDAPSASQSRCRGAMGNTPAFSGDLSGLVAALFQSHDGEPTSQPIQLVDATSKRAARLQFTTEPGDEHYLAIFALDGVPDHRKLYTHTVLVDLAAGESLTLPIVKFEFHGQNGQETVIAHLEGPDLDRLAAAPALELRLHGFDRTFAAELGQKAVAKIRRFQQGILARSIDEHR